MNNDTTKLVFKGMSIFMLVISVISIIKAFSQYGMSLVVIIACLPVIFIAIMAYSGFQGNYDRCKKMAAVVLVLDAIGLVASGFSGSAILSVILAGIYLFLCIALNSKY